MDLLGIERVFTSVSVGARYGCSDHILLNSFIMVIDF